MSTHWSCIPLDSTASYTQVHIKWHTQHLNFYVFIKPNFFNKYLEVVNILKLREHACLSKWLWIFLHIRMKFIFDSQVTSIFQIMTLFNIELSMTLGSQVFDPYQFPCSPQADACVASWNTPLSPLYLYPSRPLWTSHWFVSCMKSSLSI